MHTKEAPVITPIIRIPARLIVYMDGHNWWDGDTDEGREATIAAVKAGRLNADRSVSVPALPLIVAVLREEGEHLLDSTGWGDNTADDRADANAARAMIRRCDEADRRTTA